MSCQVLPVGCMGNPFITALICVSFILPLRTYSLDTVHFSSPPVNCLAWRKQALPKLRQKAWWLADENHSPACCWSKVGHPWKTLSPMRLCWLSQAQAGSLLLQPSQSGPTLWLPSSSWQNPTSRNSRPPDCKRLRRGVKFMPTKIQKCILIPWLLGQHKTGLWENPETQK